MEAKDILVGVWQYGIIAAFAAVLLLGAYSTGKLLLRRCKVPSRFFWTAYILAMPALAAPVVLFASLFMDKVKHEDMIPVAWLLINTWAVWFILGFIGSLKLHGKLPSHFAILPSILSWGCRYRHIRRHLSRQLLNHNTSLL